MKLSYREKIGLLIFLIVVVIIIFVAWPIKLIRSDIKSHESSQKIVQKEYDDNNAMIDEIPRINKSIEKVYDDSKGYSADFIEGQKNFKADQYLAEVLNGDAYKKDDKNLVEIVGNFRVDDAAADDLEFYYYTPNIVVYPILEAADINGNLLETKDKVLNGKVQNALSIESLEQQKVEKHTVSVDARFTKASLFAFEDQIKAIDPGIRITNVTIDDYYFGLLSEKPEDQGYSKGTITFCFYTMQQIDKPNLK